MEYRENNENRATDIASRCFDGWFDRDVTYQNFKESKFWEAVCTGNLTSFRESIYGDGDFIKLRDCKETYTATAIYDASGETIENSWDDFFYFRYLTQEQWDNREEHSTNYARAFFDREKLNDVGRKLLNENMVTSDAKVLRFTGFFDETEFVPSKIEYIKFDDFQNALSSKGSGNYTVSGIVSDYDLQWTTLYEDETTDKETVSIYADFFDVCFSKASPSFSYNGKKYTDVNALLSEIGPTLISGYNSVQSRYEGLDFVILSVNYSTTYDGETTYSPYYYGKDAYAEEAPELNFYTVSAVYCSPWRTAIKELRSVYIVTFLFVAVLAALVSNTIGKKLIPLVQLSEETVDRIYKN
jgi:hypothetical protein